MMLLTLAAIPLIALLRSGGRMGTQEAEMVALE
jgi:hypothetical protein